MSDQYKINREMAVARPFADFLRSRGETVNSLRPGDITKREPDAVFESSEGPRGIEVATGYYDDDEAKNINVVARGKPKLSKRHLRPGDDIKAVLRQAGLIVNPADKLQAALQVTLDEHSQKKYSVPTYLVLEATAGADPLTRFGPGEPDLASELILMADSTFLEVYLAMTDSVTDKIVFLPVTRSVASS